jgi:hypothetical protein
MTPELEQHIIEKYPLIFSQRCEMSINDGWFDIIDMLCANIQNRIDNVVMQRGYAMEWNKDVNDPDYDWSDKSSFIKREERVVPELVEQVVATQIKEKFGSDYLFNKSLHKSKRSLVLYVFTIVVAMNIFAALTLWQLV